MDRPPQYGAEYHGIQSKEEITDLLGSEDGRYLVRSTKRGQHILSFMWVSYHWQIIDKLLHVASHGYSISYTQLYSVHHQTINVSAAETM